MPCLVTTKRIMEGVDDEYESFVHEARYMASLSHPCRWMLLGDLRVRCNGMSDLSFTRGLWRAEAEGLLEHSYSSQSYRFLSRLKSLRFTSMISRAINDVSQCLLITVHYLPFNILLGDIKRCLRTTQLAPAVRDVFWLFHQARETCPRGSAVRCS